MSEENGAVLEVKKLSLLGMRACLKRVMFLAGVISEEASQMEEWTQAHVKALDYYLKGIILDLSGNEPTSEDLAHHRLQADQNWKETVDACKRNSTNPDHFVNPEGAAPAETPKEPEPATEPAPEPATEPGVQGATDPDPQDMQKMTDAEVAQAEAAAATEVGKTPDSSGA